MKTYSRKRTGERSEVIINLNELCRLCLAKDNELLPIFGDEDSIPLPLRIMACVALEVVEDDGLPNMICHPCRYQLEKTYIFRKKCESSDIKLRRHLKLISGSGKSDDEADEEFIEEITDEVQPQRQHDQQKTGKPGKNVKDLLDEILAEEQDMKEADQSKEDECKQSTTRERELIGATMAYIQDDENVEENDPEDITLSMDTEHINKEACTLKTSADMKTEIMDPDVDDILDESSLYLMSEDQSDGQDEHSNLESIAEAVKATLAAQPGLNINGDLQVRLDSGGPGNVTQVQVTTEDGSIVVMELMTEDEPVPQLMQEDEDGELKVFQCPNCPKAFARRIQLNRHSSVHMQQRGFTCGACEKWFPTRSALIRHERIHTGEKPFECGVCKRCFAQKEILYRHLMVHTGQRPYNCPHCEKGFTQREALRVHIRSHIKPNPADIQLHKCTLCPKVFCHASGLSRHLITHTGKTFKCRDCEKPFSDKSSLRRHHRMMGHQS